MYQILFACSQLLIVSMASASVIHVSVGADGPATGTSWEAAMPSLQDALLAAQSGDEVWVSVGRYVPRSDEGSNPRLATFEIPPGVSVYGGFAGNELSRDARALLFEDTVLNGDVLGDDEPDFINRDENTRHVVTIVNSGDMARIDGFLVSGGHAGPSGDAAKRSGAGLIIQGSAQVANVTFRDNLSRGSTVEVAGGAGACLLTGTATFTSCRFEGNQHTQVLNSNSNGNGGGGLACRDGLLLLESCTFVANRLVGGWRVAGAGLGVIPAQGETAAAEVSNCTFEDNLLDMNGALGFGGGLGVLSSGGDASCLVEDSVFRGNQILADAQSGTGAGGGIASSSTGTGGQIDLTVQGCTISGNRVQRDVRDGLANLGGGVAVSCNTGVFTLNLRDSVVTGNVVRSFNNGAQGGGVAIFDTGEHMADLRITNCFIGFNALEAGSGFVHGAGLYAGPLAGGRLLMANTEVRGNVARALADDERLVGVGGGLWTGMSGEIDLQNVAIVGNRALDRAGAQIGLGTQSMRFSSSTVAFSQSDDGQPGVRFRVDEKNTVTVTNSVFWGNAIGQTGIPAQQVTGPDGRVAVYWSNLQGGQGDLAGADNLDINPMFGDALGSDGVPNSGDEVVRLSALSPCIDAGNNELLARDLGDLDGDGDANEPLPLDAAGRPRIQQNHMVPDTGFGAGDLVDLGALEYELTCPGDLNLDGRLDLKDLAVMLQALGTVRGQPDFEELADLYPNERIDISDLAAFLASFGNTCP